MQQQKLRILHFSYYVEYYVINKPPSNRVKRSIVLSQADSIQKDLENLQQVNNNIDTIHWI